MTTGHGEPSWASVVWYIPVPYGAMGRRKTFELKALGSDISQGGDFMSERCLPKTSSLDTFVKGHQFVQESILRALHHAGSVCVEPMDLSTAGS